MPGESRALWLRVLRQGVALVLAVAMGASAVVAADTPSLDEIKASLKRQRERIQSLYVETKQECRSPLRLEELRKLPDYWYFPGFSTEEVRFAFKGEKRYSRALRTCMKTLRSADNQEHERSQIPDGPTG